MRSPRLSGTSLDIASSPPICTSPAHIDEIAPEDTLSYSSPPGHGGLELSPTQTLTATSSPELPSLPSFPSLAAVQKTQLAESEAVERGPGKAYYTASWGSPYQNLPPGYSDDAEARKPSLVVSSDDYDDYDDSLPHHFGLAHLVPSRLPTFVGTAPTRPSTPTKEVPSSLRDALLSGRSPFVDTLVGEQNNWPSDASSLGDRRSSIESVDAWDLSNKVLRTPLVSERQRGDERHKTRIENLTSRPEDIWHMLGSKKTQAVGDMQQSRYAEQSSSPQAKRTMSPEQQSDTSRPTETMASPPVIAHGVAMASRTLAESLTAARPAGPQRVATSPLRKRVVCQGKTVTILLPPETPHVPGGPLLMPLSRAEVQQKLDGFEKLGYDTRGFNHCTGGTLDPCEAATKYQNREVYPLASEMTNLVSRPLVKIPRKQDWDDYVNYLTEQKLRALGVSLGDEPPMPSSQPSSAPLSRQNSSQYPHSKFSPPPLSSAVSLQHGRNLPGGFVPGHASRQSMASSVSSIGNPRLIGHMSRQSMFVSPSFPPAPTPPALGRWSPQQFGNRNGNQNAVSPAISALSPNAPPSAGEAASPVSPWQFPNPGSFPFGAREDLLQQMQRQQQQMQAQHLQQAQGLRSHSVLQELQEEPEPEEEMAPPVQQAKSSRPELANPKPRHDKNVSVQLERDVQTDGYNLEDYIKKQFVDDEEIAEENEPVMGPVEPPGLQERVQKPDETLIPASKVTSTTGGSPPSVSKSEDSFDFITSPTSGSFTTSGYVSKASSVSKFNVEAREFKFNPTASFSPGIFSSKSFSFQPAAKANLFSPQPPLHGLGATVKVPGFNPSVTRGSIFSGDFNLTSSHRGFKPDAPVFQPGFSIGSGSASESGKKIFGNIDFGDIVKPAKKSRAVPIVKPDTPRSLAHDEPQEDEMGRLAQADGRQKRARREGDDGNDEPIFAFPMHPFEAEKTPQPQPQSDAIAKEGSATPTNDIVGVQQVTSPEPSAVKLDDSGLQDGQSEMSPFQQLSSAVAGEPVKSNPGHARKVSALSATAKPFVFKPWTTEWPEQKTNSEDEVSELVDSEAEEDGEVIVGLAQQMKSQLPAASSPIIPTSDQESDAAVVNSRHGREHESAKGFDFDFDDIDAVMQQLNDQGSEMGVERDEGAWPLQSTSRPTTANVTAFDTPILEPPHASRSGAPSPSPRSTAYASQQRPELREDESTASRDPFGDRAAEDYESAAREPLLDGHIESQASDWDDEISSAEGDKMKARSSFFDTHVDNLLQDVLATKLRPLEKTMQAIQASLAAMSESNTSRHPQRKAKEDSDADDEDEDEVHGTVSPVRSRSVPRDKRLNKIKAVVQEAIASQQARQRTPPREESGLGIEATEFYQAIADVKASAAFFASKSLQLDDVRETVEEALRKQKADATDRGAAFALDPEVHQISQLAKELADAKTRADQAVESRNAAEAREADMLKRLTLAEEEIGLFKMTTLDDEVRHKAFDKERQNFKDQIADIQDMRDEQANKLSSLTDQNAALEATLKEYRISHDRWRADYDVAQAEKEKTRASLEAIQFQAQEAMRVRESMRSRLASLREEMKIAAGQMAQQQARWNRDDEQHRKRYEVLTARLGAEARTRERLEQEMERLEDQERGGMRLRGLLEDSKAANARLEELVESLKLESAEHQKTAEKYAREFREARDTGRSEVQRTQYAMQAEIDTARNQVNIIRADLEAQVVRAQAETENVRMDMDTAKERHELMLEQEADTRRDLLWEQSAIFDSRLEELRQRHQRAVQHALEERNMNEQRLKDEHANTFARLIHDHHSAEGILTDKLALADDKVEHLQDKVAHLQEKLEVAKSAAHAAALAAQSAKSPATVIQDAVAASQFALMEPPFARPPEKISPQALRESIAVLQEQLQAREIRIEELESEMEALDKEAPGKLKERDTELSWLRELLGVRSDDLSELINALAQPAFDREAVRNAAIRIRTNLQMEMHEKQRLANGGVSAPVIPALASISNFASPKAARLAAAVNNWRRGSSAAGTPSGLDRTAQSAHSASSSRTHQTPSRPASSSQGFLSGLMTPPHSNLRRTPSPHASTGARHETEMVRPGSSASIATAITSIAMVSPRSKRGMEEQPVFPSNSSRRAMLPPARLGTPPLLQNSSYDHHAESAGDDYSGQGFFEDEASFEDGVEDAVPFETFGATR